jgi:hypothetical protein
MHTATHSTRTVTNDVQAQKYLETTEMVFAINPLNTELNPICHLLALAAAHHFVHVSRLKVKSAEL